MKIVSATYVDHQEVINYPLKQVIKAANKFDDCYIFAADEGQKSVIRSLEIVPDDRLIVINQNVNNPSDIAHAENKALDWIFNHTDADFVVWVHADVILGDNAEIICREFAIPENLTMHQPFVVWQLRMFCKMYHTIFGAVIIGRKDQDRFPVSMDGGYLSGTQSPLPIYCYDVGFLDAQTMLDKDKSHSIVWKSSNYAQTSTLMELLENAGKTCGLTVKTLLPRLVSSEDMEIWRYIRERDLGSEYNEVKAILETPQS